MGTAAIGLAGCVGNDDENTGDGEPDGGIVDGGDGGNSSGDGDDTQTDEDAAPTWLTATIEDATTGEEFSILGLDQPVVLHTFARWCSKCLSQQQNTKSLYESRSDEVAFVDLTIDENDNPDDIVNHAEDHGFDWRFGVASNEVTSSLVDDFGQDVTVAPSSPVIVVCPDGAAYKLGKGISGEDIGSAIDSNCV